MPNLITREEYEKLNKELDKLKKKDRPKVSKDLKEAISQGDLSENAAYTEAKERQAETEGRIRAIENKLAQSEIIEASQGSDNIDVGSTFRAIDEEIKEERTFSIVGPAVSSPSDGRISFDSPLGSAFLGHKKGDVVDVLTPGGKKTYRILDII